MKRSLPYAFLFASLAFPALASDQQALDQCIASWGAKSPFRKGTPATTVLSTGVKEFGAIRVTRFGCPPGKSG